ncbi:MAG TPA: hypothetical protein VGG64_22050 [Pirellulales bacterium]|jgi:uncharacterized protein YjeT (DUF2065 family)
MDVARWVTLIALTLFLVEGFTLSVFPTQFKEFLAQADPRALQAMGLIETVAAVSLIAGILVG